MLLCWFPFFIKKKCSLFPNHWIVLYNPQVGQLQLAAFEQIHQFSVGKKFLKEAILFFSRRKEIQNGNVTWICQAI